MAKSLFEDLQELFSTLGEIIKMNKDLNNQTKKGSQNYNKDQEFKSNWISGVTKNYKEWGRDSKGIVCDLLMDKEFLNKGISVLYLFKRIRHLMLVYLLPVTLVLWLIFYIFFVNYSFYFKFIVVALITFYIVSFLLSYMVSLRLRFSIFVRRKSIKEEYQKELEKQRKIEQEEMKARYEASITCSHCGTKNYKDEDIHYEKIREYNHIEIEEQYNGTRKRIPYLIEEYVITYKRNCCGYEYTQDKRLWINKQTGERQWK